VAQANENLRQQGRQWRWDDVTTAIEANSLHIVSGRLTMVECSTEEEEANLTHKNEMDDNLEQQAAQAQRRGGRAAGTQVIGCILCARMMRSRDIIFPAGLGTGCCHCKRFRQSAHKTQDQDHGCKSLITKREWEMLQGIWYGIIHNANLVLTGNHAWCTDELVKQWSEDPDADVFEPMFRLCKAASKAIVGPALGAAVSELGAATLECVVEQHIENLKRHFQNLLVYVNKEREDMQILTEVCEAAQKRCWKGGPGLAEVRKMTQLLGRLQLTGKRLRCAHSCNVWSMANLFFKMATQPDNGDGYFDYRQVYREMNKAKGPGQCCCRCWTPHGADTRDDENDDKETLGEERGQSRNEWHETTGYKSFLRYACMHMLRTIQTSQDDVAKARDSRPGGSGDDAAAALIAKLQQSMQEPMDVDSWKGTDAMDADGFSCLFGVQRAAGETLTCIHRHGQFRRGYRYGSPCSVCACDSIAWLRLGDKDFNTRQERDLQLLNSWSEEGQNKVRTLHPLPFTLHPYTRTA